MGSRRYPDDVARVKLDLSFVPGRQQDVLRLQVCVYKLDRVQEFDRLPERFSLPNPDTCLKKKYTLQVLKHVCFVLFRPYRMAQPRRARHLHRNSHMAEDSYLPQCTPPEKDYDLTLNDHKMAGYVWQPGNVLHLKRYHNNWDVTGHSRRRRPNASTERTVPLNGSDKR